MQRLIAIGVTICIVVFLGWWELVYARSMAERAWVLVSFGLGCMWLACLLITYVDDDP